MQYTASPLSVIAITAALQLFNDKSFPGKQQARCRRAEWSWYSAMINKCNCVLAAHVRPRIQPTERRYAHPAVSARPIYTHRQERAIIVALQFCLASTVVVLEGYWREWRPHSFEGSSRKFVRRLREYGSQRGQILFADSVGYGYQVTVARPS